MPGQSGDRKNTKEPPTIRLGVEIECLPRFDNGGKVNSKEAREARYKAIADRMNKYLKGKPWIDVASNPSGRADPRTSWKLEYDSSVKGKTHHDNTCPIEIISPILVDDGKGGSRDWQNSLERIFDALDDRSIGGVSKNGSCSTHIHLSPGTGTGKWVIEDLRKISCCILYFERMFQAMYPGIDDLTKPQTPSQRASAYEGYEEPRLKYVKANWTDNPVFGGKSYSQCIEQIEEVEDVDGLRNLMNTPERGGYNDRYFAWNFENLRKGKIGTIEYRRPPGVHNYDQCLKWIRLALTFVRAAMQVEDVEWPLGNKKQHYEVQREDFRRFSQKGLPAGQTILLYFGNFLDLIGKPIPVKPFQKG